MTVHDLEQHHRAIYIDIELTCWSGSPPPGMKQEIVEIGIVEMDLMALTITREKSHFIRPRRWEISSQCTDLTGITTDDIRSARPFAEVLDLVTQEFNPQKALCCTWGGDAGLIADACRSHGLKSPLRHLLDLAHFVQNLLLLRDRPSLRNGVKLLGLEFDGVPHCALVDARNTARVHAAVVRRMRGNPDPQRPPPAKAIEGIHLSSFAEKLQRSLSTPSGNEASGPVKT